MGGLDQYGRSVMIKCPEATLARTRSCLGWSAKHNY